VNFMCFSYEIVYVLVSSFKLIYDRSKRSRVILLTQNDSSFLFSAAAYNGAAIALTLCLLASRSTGVLLSVREAIVS